LYQQVLILELFLYLQNRFQAASSQLIQAEVLLQNLQKAVQQVLMKPLQPWAEVSSPRLEAELLEMPPPAEEFFSLQQQLCGVLQFFPPHQFQSWYALSALPWVFGYYQIPQPCFTFLKS
jgi:hypothetical protein